MLIRIETQERISEESFRFLYPNVSFPAQLTADVLLDFGYAPLIYSQPPVAPFGQVVVDAGTTLVDGVWTVGYSCVDMAPEELALAQEVLQRVLTNAVQAHLDSTAADRNYDGILSLCTYADDPNPRFAAEGQAGKAWRSAAWTYCYQVLADATDGLRGIPTAEQLVAELPAFVWPS